MDLHFCTGRCVEERERDAQKNVLRSGLGLDPGFQSRSYRLPVGPVGDQTENVSARCIERKTAAMEVVWERDDVWKNVLRRGLGPGLQSRSYRLPVGDHQTENRLVRHTNCNDGRS